MKHNKWTYYYEVISLLDSCISNRYNSLEVILDNPRILFQLRLHQVFRRYSIIEIGCALNLIEIPDAKKSNYLYRLRNSETLNYFQKRHPLPIIERFYNRVASSYKYQNEYIDENSFPIYIKLLTLYDEMENDEQIEDFVTETYRNKFSVYGLFRHDLMHYSNRDNIASKRNAFEGYLKYITYIYRFHELWKSSHNDKITQEYIRLYILFSFSDTRMSLSKIIEQTAHQSINIVRYVKEQYSSGTMETDSSYAKEVLEDAVYNINFFLKSVRELIDYDSEIVLDWEEILI